MTKQARRPGRPKGTGIDDRLALDRIADCLLDRRARSVAAAVRLFAADDPSLIRRLQRKFNRDRQALLRSARVRAETVALREGQREVQIQRATRPRDWRHAHDAVTQLMDAVSLERSEVLKKTFARE